MLRLGRANRLAQPDLAGALGHRNQHDVDDTHRAQRQRHNAHAAQEDIHRREYLAHQLVALDGVPLFEGIGVIGAESVPAGDNCRGLLPWPTRFSPRIRGWY